MHRNKQRSSCRLCRLRQSLAVPLQGWAFQHAGGGTEKQLPPEKVYKCPEPNRNAADILQIFPMSPCRCSLSAESKSRRKLPSSGQKCPNHILQKSWYCPERMRSSVPWCRWAYRTILHNKTHSTHRSSCSESEQKHKSYRAEPAALPSVPLCIYRTRELQSWRTAVNSRQWMPILHRCWRISSGEPEHLESGKSFQWFSRYGYGRCRRAYPCHIDGR